MKILNYIKKINNNGQGLIEVIVSLAIIVVAILGALSLATLTIQAGTQSRERVQAALLAQEGIEVAKNYRDTNWLKDIPWNNRLILGISVPNDPINFSSINLNGNVGGDFSNFNRTTTISTIPSKNSNEEVQINCTVSWTDSSGEHDVTAVDYITNWQLE
jgi:Tfp pilus assembly protein PilV